MDSATMRQQLLELLHQLSFRRGDFILASGARSEFYIDCRQTTLTSRGHNLVGQLMLEQIAQYVQRGFGPFSAIGGMALGAAPLVSAVSTLSAQTDTPLNGFLVRKQAKDHGTSAKVEGLAAIDKGQPVVLLEDVVTSGGSLLKAVDATLDSGLRVPLVLALVDRQQGGAKKIADRGITFKALFDLEEIAAESQP